jgi:hypothetical protein
MRTIRMLFAGALGVMLGAAPLSAQTAAPWQGRQPAIDGHYTRLTLDARERLVADGVGGRLMWSAIRPEDAGTSWLADRTSIGLFGAYTPDQDLGFSTVHLGAVVDLQPVPTPLAGRVTPFASLGVGALRTNVSLRTPAALRTRSPLTEHTNTTPTLAPGAGLRVALAPGLALQGDVRDVMTFRRDTRHNVALEVGLRLTR